MRLLLIGCVGLALITPSVSPAGLTRAPEPAVTARTLAILEEAEPDLKVWVYFTDKNILSSADYEARIDQVAAGFAPHARDRRRRAMGSDLADFRDIPVHAPYVRELAACGARIVHESRWLNAVSVRAPRTVLRAIADLPFVCRLVPVGRGRSIRPRTSPGQPPMIRERYDYGPSHDQLEEIGVIDAHDSGLSGAGVVVAMMDTGYNWEHPAFADVVAEGRILAQWDVINDDGETQDEPGDPEFQHAHGTMCWSLVGGFEEGELIGAAYGASFLLAKTEDTSDETPIEEDHWVAAMEWADGLGADIISSSLAYILWYQYSDMDGDTAVTTIAADVAASRGIVVCTAAGNYGTQDWYYIGAPADGDSVIAVGATRPDGELWDDSSHGPTYDGRIKPEVVARGDNNYCAIPWGFGHGDPAWYHQTSGTSVSTPLVAGAAALILEAHPSWSAMMVREALMLTADNAHDPNNDRGWGRIDVMAALDHFPPSAVALASDGVLQLAASPNPARGEGGVTFALPGGRGWLALFTSEGRCVRRHQPPIDARTWFWDGRDQEGRPLGAGVYLARWQAGLKWGAARVVLHR